MSAVQIQGNASGTGTLTIAAPNTNTNQTLTLPDQTGTLIAGTSGVAGEANGGTGTTTGYYGFKNRIINGWMAINQRVSSLSTNNTWNYFIDRMWGFSGSGTAATFSQISSTGVAGLPYGARAQRTAANTGTSAIYTGQIVESNNLQDLQGQAVSISFWARAGANYSSASNALSVFLRTGTTADQGLTALITGWAGAADQTTTVTLTTSFQKFTVTTFTVGATAQELSVFFGYTPVGTAGANDYVDITGVQLEKGSTATSFDYRPYGTELSLCQRYYSILLTYSTDYNIPVTRSSATDCQIYLYAPVTMRTTPTLGIPSGYGRMICYDTSFSLSIGTVSAMSTIYTADNRFINIFMTTTSVSGTASVFASYDTFGTTTNMTVSAEL